ncbi:MAG: MmpL protein [Frankiales bacterium]|nr:MmpL protein [Frankiales bacterium]
MTTASAPVQLGFVRRHRIGLRALVVVLIWFFGVGGGLGSLSAKLADVQKNTNASFLPGKAESTKALNLQETFLPKDQVPTVVLYERAGGLTAADKARATEDLAQIRATSWLNGQPSEPIPSADGKALQVYLPLDGHVPDVFIKNVKALRTLLARPGQPAGLNTYVTGLGGLQADLFEVFGSIDTTLILSSVVVVILLLLVVYRSPVLWLAPLLSVGLAYTAAAGVVYLLAKNDVLTVNGQSQGILTVLTFGAGTDYALLLIARYREELHLHERPWDAMRSALRGAAPAIIASATTVILGLLCLLASELSSNQGLGPVTAIGIACAAVTMLTLLPALLVPFGRRIFWPRVPHLDGQDPVHEGPWAWIADVVRRRSTLVSAATAVVLLALALLSTTLHASGIPQSKAITGNSESVIGQEHLAKHFPAGSGSPVDVIAPAGQADAALAVVRATPSIAAAAVTTTTGAPDGSPKVVNGKVLIEAVLAVPSDSPLAARAVTSLRTRLDMVSKDALVGGFTAIDLDIQDASQRDRIVIIPLVLLVILLVLAILLRSILAPLLLVATVVVSFLATLGVCAVVFQHVFHFAGADSAFPLFAFVFLVALGIDYNIFLMTRVREEALVRGTHTGMLRALTVTGGVITSAGIVLAATFTVLGVLPLVFLAELGFAVAFGVLLDTLVVRSLLVPALTLLIGDRIWWPSALSKGPSGASPAAPRSTEPATAD